MTALAAPRLDRALTLHMMGDWGIANLHRICGWLAAEMGARAPLASRFAIWNGRGGADAFAAVLEGRVDTALFVPAGFARTVVEGKGIYRGAGVERLRALATLPQDDRLVICADSALGLHTLDDVRRKRPALRIAAARDDGENMTGFATHRLLEAAGLDREVLEAWGCRFLEGEAPWDVIPLATSGAADMLIFEAVMTPWWKELLAKRAMTFIPIEDAVLDRLARDYAWARGTVPASRFEGLAGPFETLDFSDFLLFGRDDLPDDVAYLMAWCLCETRDTLESQYRHLKPEDSPVTWPLDPRRLARTAIPLHPGAERYYREAGYLD